MTKRAETPNPSDSALGPSFLLAQLTALVSWYGAAEVKRTLAKITTGAPKKTDDKLKTWLAVEVFLFHTPGSSIKGACRDLSKYARQLIKSKCDLTRFYVISGNPETIRRIHSEINGMFKRDPHLRAAWQWQLDSACGRRTALKDGRATGKEAQKSHLAYFLV